MTTATLPETAESEWWTDGRNVTLLASWVREDVHRREDPVAVAETLVGIYERPWEYGWLRDEFLYRLGVEADKLLGQ